MDSDDDYQSFSPPMAEPSPQVQHRRLKSLKKNSLPSNSIDDDLDLLSLPKVDFAKLEVLEASLSKTPEESHSDDSNQPLPLSQSSSESGCDRDREDNENENEKENSMEVENEFVFGEDRRETKRALEFDDLADSEELEKEGLVEGEENIKKKKNKRIKTAAGDDMKIGKRNQEKERKAHLQQLHAESQRLLRETRDASFKPIPVVTKPISSVLEKIRQRKLQVTKKIVMQKSSVCNAQNKDSTREVMAGLESGHLLVEEKENNLVNAVEEHSAGHQTEVPDEKTTPKFRAPIDDTQDLFGDSQTRDSEAELPGDHQDSPVEEVLVPSLLSVDLKLDCVPSDDSSSEEDKDKENIDPLPRRCEDDSTSPRGDPVKVFVDEEAEEEDDSDHDLLRFPENEEDEYMEDSEEFNDIIATEYKEKPIDNEKRNELHQKWLEQQDAAGTDNLLQRLKVGLKQSETPLQCSKEEESDDEEDYTVEGEEATASRYPARINLKKAKQIISEMFLDKDDLFLSDDDEETEKKLVKNHVLVRAEEHAALVSPIEDESSREVFGLIKKLNIAPESRKKAKSSSYFDSMLKGGNCKSFSKSSFLGRLSKNPLPSCQKKGSSTVRPFIFGRDDSNSRSSISMSEESSDTTSKENQPIRTARAMPNCSQAKFSSQYRNASGEIASSGSLFETLKRSSIQSSVGNHDNPVDLTHVMATFKIKKSIKIEGRS